MGGGLPRGSGCDFEGEYINDQQFKNILQMTLVITNLCERSRPEDTSFPLFTHFNAYPELPSSGRCMRY